MTKQRDYQQCTRCVMDTTDPEIVFNEEGICNHCTDFIQKKEEVRQLKKLGQEYLDTIISKIKEKGKGKKYDALLGISGGVDSCYAAYLLKQYGIRTLLVHLDNGWNTNDAAINIKQIATRLGFDYMSYVLDWEEFKDIQLSFLKASVVEAETPTDVAIPGSLHKVAASHGIKYIISGGNLATEGILPKLWHYNAKDTKYFNYIQKTYGKLKPKKFPNFSFEKEFYYKMIKGIKIIYLLNYVAYDKDEAKQLLIDELGWKDYGGKHHESVFTKFIQSYLLVKKFNLDYRKATLSSQIINNAITRDEALAILKTPAYNEEEIAKDKIYIAKKLSISMDELEQIIEKPGKYYYEYPNDEKRLTMIYNLYRKFFSK